MKIEFRPTDRPEWLGFLQRSYFVEVFIDDERVTMLTARDVGREGYEIWQRGGEDLIRITGRVKWSMNGTMLSWWEPVRASNGWLVLLDVDLAFPVEGVPEEDWLRLPLFNSYQGRGGFEVPGDLIPGYESELMMMLRDLFTVLTAKLPQRNISQAIEKLNVAAGDYCLTSDEVPRGDTWVITSICAKASCSGVTQMTLSRNYMNNVFKAKQVLNPSADELICQKGMWILKGGEFIQVCFTDVAEGCNLYLYINGGWSTYLAPPVVEAPVEESLYGQSNSGIDDVVDEGNALGAPDGAYADIGLVLNVSFDAMYDCRKIIITHDTEGVNLRVRVTSVVDAPLWETSWTQIYLGALPAGNLEVAYEGMVGTIELRASIENGGSSGRVDIDAVELWYEL